MTTTNTYRGPKTTVDAIILEPNESLVLVIRGNPPYQGQWALPGGFVELGEKVEDAVRREVKEETNLTVEIIKLSGVYSEPNRDPRGHTISIAYLCRRNNTSDILKGGSDAKEAKVFQREALKKLQLAFDHERIINEALEIADQEKLW